jgi:hypothetical protein
MNINIRLLEEIQPYLNPRSELSPYDLSKEMVEPFLFHTGSFSERQEKAIDIIEGIMGAHGKGELIKTVIELARVEHGIGELEPKARDHVVHALLSFILGIYINEKVLRPLWDVPVDTFQWKLAGLFHDVGYPVELATEKLIGRYLETINSSKEKIGVAAPDIHFPIDFSKLVELRNDKNSFDLIQNRLTEWNLHIDARAAYKEMSNSGRVNHGVMSGLSVLYLIDLLYQKFNPKREYKDITVPQASTRVNFNQIYFERDVVSACAAIYIHSLSPEWFTRKKIDRSRAPVAFLLRLSDVLQEWERPNRLNPAGFSADLFDIRRNDSRLFLIANLEPNAKQEMEHKIRSTLIAPDVRIVQPETHAA